MTKVDYDESVMGSIEFQFDYIKNKTHRKTITQLVTDVIDDLNKNVDSENVAIHFHLENIEDETWFELNGLIREAYERRNKEKPTLQIIHDYLTAEQLDRFSILIERLSERRK